MKSVTDLEEDLVNATNEEDYELVRTPHALIRTFSVSTHTALHLTWSTLAPLCTLSVSTPTDSDSSYLPPVRLQVLCRQLRDFYQLIRSHDNYIHLHRWPALPCHSFYQADKIDSEITDAKVEAARLLQVLHLTEEELATMI